MGDRELEKRKEWLRSLSDFDRSFISKYGEDTWRQYKQIEASEQRQRLEVEKEREQREFLDSFLLTRDETVKQYSESWKSSLKSIRERDQIIETLQKTIEESAHSLENAKEEYLTQIRQKAEISIKKLKEITKSQDKQRTELLAENKTLIEQLHVESLKVEELERQLRELEVKLKIKKANRITEILHSHPE